MRAPAVTCLLVFSLLLTVSAFAQTSSSHPDDIYWSDQFAAPGGGIRVGNYVRDVVVYDDQLVLAGDFKMIGSSPYPGIATWDGGRWGTFRSGIAGNVITLQLWDNKIVAGGNFEANEQIPSQNLVAWTGTEWVPVGTGLPKPVEKLALWNGRLAIASNVTPESNFSKFAVYFCDGINWDSIPTRFNDAVTSMVQYENDLIIGGRFDSAGSRAIGALVRWDGSEISRFELPVKDNVLSAIIFDNQLVISLAQHGAYKWNGQDWEKLGDLGGDIPVKLFTDSRRLLAITYGSYSHITLFEWTGTEWACHPFSYGGSSLAATFYNDWPVIAGNLGDPGSVYQPPIAMFQNGDWITPTGLGLEGTVHDLTVFGGELVAVGAIFESSFTKLDKIACFDGRRWRVPDNVPEVDGIFYKSFTYQGVMYILAGNCDSHSHCSITPLTWDGKHWDSIPQYSWGGFDLALTKFKKKIILAAREDEYPYGKIIVGWDGFGWTDYGHVGNLHNPPLITAMSTYEGELYVTGDFDHIDNVECQSIAKYDGQSWQKVPARFPEDCSRHGTADRLKEINGKLYLIRDTKCLWGIAAWCEYTWTGSEWKFLPSTIGDPREGTDVLDLIGFKGDLYVAGNFTRANYHDYAFGIARKEKGTWVPLGSGINVTTSQPDYVINPSHGVVNTMEVYKGALYAAGRFRVAGDKVSVNIARWEPKGKLSDDPIDPNDQPIDITTLPNNHQLSQNYPNPFNPGTTISYQLDQAGPVTLTIYNLLGQTVKTLVNEHSPAGTHKIYWDGKSNTGASVASGLYFYRLTVGDQTETRKMILLK